MRQHGQVLNQGLLSRGRQVSALSRAVQVIIPDPRIAEVPREGVGHQDMVEMTTVADMDKGTFLRQLEDRNRVRAEIRGIQDDDHFPRLLHLLAGSRRGIKLEDHLLLLQAKDLRGVVKEPLGVAKELTQKIMMTGETTDVIDAALKKRSMIATITTDGEDRKKRERHRETIEEGETIAETTEEADPGFTSAQQPAEVCWQGQFSWRACQKQKLPLCGPRCRGTLVFRPFAWYPEHLLFYRSTKSKRQLVTERQL